MSVKVPGKGTKGTPFPKFMAKLGNGFVLRRVRGGGMKGAGGMPVMVLHTTRREERTGPPGRARLHRGTRPTPG